MLGNSWLLSRGRIAIPRPRSLRNESRWPLPRCIGRVFTLATILSLISYAANAIAAAPLRVAIGDKPGADKLNLLIAAAQAKERGVDVKISYLLSEELAMSAVISGEADIGVGTPYVGIRAAKPSIRMFFQLSTLRFFPVVETARYTSWKDLDGADIYVASRGSATAALMNMMATRSGIRYASVNYLPGSTARAKALFDGRIAATIVDSERRQWLQNKGQSRFTFLPIPTILASDEALFATTNFLARRSTDVTAFLVELLKVSRAINKNPSSIVELKDRYQISARHVRESEAEILAYYTESVAAGVFPENGGSAEAVREDFEFYGSNGDLGEDIHRLSVEEYWDFQPLSSALSTLER